MRTLKRWWLQHRLKALGVCPVHLQKYHYWYASDAFCPICEAQEKADAERCRQKCVDEAIKALEAL